MEFTREHLIMSNNLWEIIFGFQETKIESLVTSQFKMYEAVKNTNEKTFLDHLASNSD